MVFGKKHKAKPAWVFGYTTRNHLCIDLDDTSFYKVERLARMLMRSYPEIGNCLILQSSTSRMEIIEYINPYDGYRKIVQRNNYHIVFNNFVDYEYSCKIIETLAWLDAINHDYVNIREMRQDMTLRVSKKVNTLTIQDAPKPFKYIINQYSTKQNNGIELYMQLRNCFPK